jgi:hypothetical protein
MERFLGALGVRPHIPVFYPSLSDAKLQYQIVQSLQQQLDLVKGVQSKKKLTYKGALLDIVVSSGDLQGKGEALAQLLKVKLDNIFKALLRQTVVETSRASEFALSVRRK